MFISSGSFHESVSPGHLKSIQLKPLQTFTEIRRDIHNFVFIAETGDKLFIGD
jgi:hypothetical protein